MRLTSRLRSLPLRARLTALYGGAFFLAGGLLVGVMYGIMALNLEREPSLAFDVSGPDALPHASAPSTETLPAPDDTLVRRIQTAEEQRREETLNGLLWQSLGALGIVGVSATALGYLMAGRALRPLSQVTATARRVAGRSLHERIALDGPPDEIKELADTFDEMLARLDRAFAGQRHFVGNASHELRTPLAIERTLIEVAMTNPSASEDLKRLGTTLLATNERSERLIDGLLTLARTEHEMTDRTEVDLAELADGAVQSSAAEAQLADVNVHRELAPCSVSGDRLLLERLTYNLVHNAVRHNVDNGCAWVRTRTAGDHAVLEVENTSSVIPGYEVPNLFEPFRRLTQDRVRSDRGVGLGLSIVRSVVTAHGGSVRARPRPDGGLVVTVELPA